MPSTRSLLTLLPELCEKLSFYESRKDEITVKEPLHGTCEWLFVHGTYIDWDAGTSDIAKKTRTLALTGKPGSGKSCALYSALRQYEQHSKSSNSDICLAFFFNAKSQDVKGDLEKSSQGFFQSLLRQVLDIRHASEASPAVMIIAKTCLALMGFNELYYLYY